jgi:hypothetical protein
MSKKNDFRENIIATMVAVRQLFIAANDLGKTYP